MIDETPESVRQYPKPGLLSKTLKATAYAHLIFGVYLLWRQVHRSVYATDYEYLNPSFIDSAWPQFLLMISFSIVYVARLYVDTRPYRPLIASRAEDDDAIRRRRSAKLFNERLKLLSSALNTVGTSAIVTGLVLPLISGAGTTKLAYVFIFLLALLCYGCAQLVVSLWKTEE